MKHHFEVNKYKNSILKLDSEKNVEGIKSKVDVGMLNAIKSVLADISSVSPSSEL